VGVSRWRATWCRSCHRPYRRIGCHNSGILVRGIYIKTNLHYKQSTNYTLESVYFRLLRHCCRNKTWGFEITWELL
jgi:hypothetical protein